MSALANMEGGVFQDISQASRNPSLFLSLPVEIRLMIFKQIFGSIIIYVRTLSQLLPPPFIYGAILNRCILERNIPYSALLLVSRQVRGEALDAILQNCVLDIWGSPVYNPRFFTYLPKGFSRIRHLATTFDRCESSLQWRLP